MATENPAQDSNISASSDPRAEAGFAQLVVASLSSRISNRFRRILLNGTLGLRPTDPQKGSATRLGLDAFRSLDSRFRLASLSQPDRTRRLIEVHSSEDATRVLERARAIERGSVELLGASWNSAPFAWHEDPTSDVKWSPDVPGRSILDAYPSPDADPKIPWELARFQFAVPLVQAWWLTREPHWAETYLEFVDSWIESNPFPLGIHWASAMEVALRAHSWTYALWHLRDAECLDEALWKRWRASLQDHERYVRLCLEWEVLGNGNHYVSNILGLTSLYQGIPGISSSRKLRSAQQRLEREVKQQTLSDGANFEGSTAYHQFVTEMFVWGAATSPAMSDIYHDRVSTQLRYLDVLCRPDGSIPRIGDDDNGRIACLSSRDTAGVLDAGFALIRGAPRRRHSEEPTLDLLMTGGEDALDRWQSSERTRVSVGWKAFPNIGIYVREESDWQITAHAGPERYRAGGGHLHSDLMSIVAHTAGCEFLLDPGTLSYAGSRTARDSLRSVSAHSTLRPKDREPRRLLEKFRTAPASCVRVEKIDDWLHLESELIPGFNAERKLRLVHGPCLEIWDQVRDDLEIGFELNFIVGSGGIELRHENDGTVQIAHETPVGTLEIRCVSSEPMDCEIMPLSAASGYGYSIDAHRVRIAGDSSPLGSIRSTLRFRETEL